MTINGIDISKYDGVWNADTARMAGCEFVFIKSSQATYSDPMFQINRVKAKAAGILRGFYHYLDWQNILTLSGEAQANYMLSLVGNDPPELPMVLDCEYQQIRNNSGVLETVPLPSNAINHIQDFTSKVETAGLRIVIYTGVGFWNNHSDPYWKDQYWKQHVGLWVANWEVAAPHIPSPWDTLPAGQQYKFWQYKCSKNKADCLKYGTSGNEIDLDSFPGTLEELKTFGSIVPPVIVPHPAVCPTCGQVWPSNNLSHQVIKGYNLNVHSPDQYGKIIGVLVTGTKIFVDNYTTPYYAHFAPMAGFPTGGWVYKAYLEKIA